MCNLIRNHLLLWNSIKVSHLERENMYKMILDEQSVITRIELNDFTQRLGDSLNENTFDYSDWNLGMQLLIHDACFDFIDSSLILVKGKGRRDTLAS